METNSLVDNIINIETTKSKSNSRNNHRIKLYTQDGHILTSKENTFINKYIELGNASQACKEAGYSNKSSHQKGKIAGIREVANIVYRKDNYIYG